MLREEPTPKLTKWTLSSLYLQEQEWISQALNNDLQSTSTGIKKIEKFSNLSYRLKPQISWYAPNILSELNIPLSNSIYTKVFESNFKSPYLWFFLGQYLTTTEESHIGVKLKLQKELLGETVSTLIKFPKCQEYSLLLNRAELSTEVKSRILAFQQESTFEELKFMDLSNVCETMSKKLDGVLFPERKKTIPFVEVSKVKMEEKKKTVEQLLTPPRKDWLKELPIPLKNSIPSLFLHRCFSPEVHKSSPQRELQPVPQFIQNLSRMVSRFSILRHYSPEEVERMVREHKNWTTDKSQIQWHDPQEKWFYWDLPAINLFYDRFREDYRHTVITNWEEPEKRLSLSKSEIGDSFDFSSAFHSPVFKYEGIPEMTIGKDLIEMNDLMDKYADIHKTQVKQELELEGAPEVPEVSWKSEDILQELEKAKEELEGSEES